tara:strand:+ start:197 stop:1726 length:1530 start_codon:yes stop_codon:yes gene_type:complete
MIALAQGLEIYIVILSLLAFILLVFLYHRSNNLIQFLKYNVHIILLISFIIGFLIHAMSISDQETGKKIVKDNLLLPNIKLTDNQSCQNASCIKSIMDTYDVKYLDYNKNANENNEPVACSDKVHYQTYTASALKQCFRTSNTFTKINPYELFFNDYFIKSSWNSCASGELKNGFLNQESLRTVIRLGCRFLDFEIFSINGDPCVATSTDENDFTFKESYNHLDLSIVLDNVKQYALSSDGCENYKDPLILHFRVKTKICKTIETMLKALHNTFGNLIVNHTFAKSHSPNGSIFRLPIGNIYGRVFVVFHNQNNGTKQIILKQKTSSQVISTWSKELNAITSEEDDLTQYESTIQKDSLHILLKDTYASKVKQYTKANDADDRIMQPMYMIHPEKTFLDGSQRISVKNMNESIKKNMFDNGDVHMFVQIIPMNVQEYQTGSIVTLNKWFQFYKSIDNTSDDDKSKPEVVWTGMRQRIFKHKRPITQSTQKINAAISNKLRNIEDDMKAS